MMTKVTIKVCLISGIQMTFLSKSIKLVNLYLFLNISIFKFILIYLEYLCHSLLCCLCHNFVICAWLLSRFSHLTLCNLMDYSLSGSSVYGILQARILQWVAISFSRVFPTQGLNLGLLLCRQILYHLSNERSPRKAAVSVVDELSK